MPGGDEPGNTSAIYGELPVEQASEGETPFSLGFYSILYGPSVEHPTSYQPKPTGGDNKDLPVDLRNFLTLAYALDQYLAVSATGYWLYKPVLGQSMTMRDPYARVSYEDIMHFSQATWYGDLRVHFPVTDLSRDQDMLAGVQTYHTLTYPIPGSRFTTALDASARVNVFGSQGRGDDLELYAGPSLSYLLHPNFSLTLLYEMGASHQFGAKAFDLYNDGTVLEPGFSWDILPSLTINPYLNLYTGNKVTLSSTSIGATLSWILL
jgi:hypothetical protein